MDRQGRTHTTWSTGAQTDFLDILFWVQGNFKVIKILRLISPQRKNYQGEASASPEILANTWKEINFHLDLCCVTSGTHIQIYLTVNKN